MEDKERKRIEKHPSPAEHSTPLSLGEGHGGEAVRDESTPAEHSTPLSLGEGQGGEAVRDESSPAKHFTPLSLWRGVGGEAAGVRLLGVRLSLYPLSQFSTILLPIGVSTLSGWNWMPWML